MLQDDTQAGYQGNWVKSNSLDFYHGTGYQHLSCDQSGSATYTICPKTTALGLSQALHEISYEGTSSSDTSIPVVQSESSDNKENVANVVPEPTTAILLSIGMLGVWALLRKKHIQ